VLVAALGAAAVLVYEGRSRPVREAAAAEFQRLVGGLGGGPAVELSGCAFNFDPRLGPRCQQDGGPIPGAGPFCPYHGCAVFSYPSPDRARRGQR
jgi:hypothetical protein